MVVPVKLFPVANDHAMVRMMVTVTVYADVPVGDQTFLAQAGMAAVQEIVERLAGNNCIGMDGLVEVDEF